MRSVFFDGGEAMSGHASLFGIDGSRVVKCVMYIRENGREMDSTYSAPPEYTVNLTTTIFWVEL